MGHISGFREGCGATIFRITPKTVKNIQQEKLLFFSEARKARGDKKHYSQWYETPLVEKILAGENDKQYATYGAEILGLGCAEEKGTNKELIRSISESYEKPGNYYSISHESILFVSPDLKIAVFAYFG